jgi:primosomal protein N''
VKAKNTPINYFLNFLISFALDSLYFKTDFKILAPSVGMDMSQIISASEHAVNAVAHANHVAAMQAHAFAQHQAVQIVVPAQALSTQTQTHVSDGKPVPGTDEWLKQRRESHKEVERRRREVINTGIAELSKIVPNCSDRNKGGILHRAVQYIQQLKEAEQRNAERWTLDKMLADQAINDLTGYVEYLKSENEALRSQITQLGGEAPPRAQPPAPSVPPYHAHAMAAAMHPGYHPYFAPPPGHWPGGAPYPHPGHMLAHPGTPQMHMGPHAGKPICIC